MPDKPKKQRIWPVFLIAATLMGLGSWLAVASAPPEATQPRIEAAPPLAVPADVTDVDAVRLTRAGAPQTLRLDVWQERRSPNHSLQTRISLMVHESAAERVGDVYSFERAYSDVRISMESDGTPFGVSIARDVERLVSITRNRVRMKATGQVIEAATISTESAQLRHVLGVLEQLIDVAQPRLPREKVLQGEVWQWSNPVASDLAGADAAAAGNTTFVARVLGATASGLVVRVSLDGMNQIDVRLDDEAPIPAAVRGSGEGTVIWDNEAGQLHSSDMAWESTSEVAGEEVTTTARVRIESE